ncbi:hypothetical protein ANO11243_046570 [Dothideomycetidae sp. 11243]|nr:hypothetical protein ANO11243_046570 [fungal sp. No.11243]
MAESATSAAAKGASYLMILQISSRAATFVLNQILLRFLTPVTLGRSVQLELYSISVLFFARESLRVAVQRVAVSDAAIPSPAKRDSKEAQVVDTTDNTKCSDQGDPSTGKSVQTVVNLAYPALLLGLWLTLILGVVCQTALLNAGYAIEKQNQQCNTGINAYISVSVAIYGLASLIELASEPGFVAAQSLLLFKVRAGAEAAATVAKTIATVSSALYAHRRSTNIGVLPFALGQLAYACALLIYYNLAMRSISSRHGFSLLLSELGDDDRYHFGYFSKPLLTIATSLSVQSGIKYVLTQGDSILIATLASLQDQGTYALASNYGGLVARMLFQPIEEASRNLFAKLCSSLGPSSGQEKAAQILSMILRLYSLITVLAVTLGPILAPLLLSFVAGSRWTDLGAGKVLGIYTYYIPLLAVNGITEAFVAAVANNKELYRQSVWMGAFFVFFAGSAWWFVAKLQLGAEGIVWANCVNMSARIVYCFWFISGYFGARGIMMSTNKGYQNFSLLSALPSAASIAVGTSIPFLLNASEGYLSAYSSLGELIRVGGVAAVVVIAM